MFGHYSTYKVTLYEIVQGEIDRQYNRRNSGETVAKNNREKLPNLIEPSMYVVSEHPMHPTKVAKKSTNFLIALLLISFCVYSLVTKSSLS